MGSNYVSDTERTELDIKRAKDQQDIANIAKRRVELVGEPKNYKGIIYQSRRDGMLVCTDAPKGVALDGAFNRVTSLFQIIDMLEREGKLPKAK